MQRNEAPARPSASRNGPTTDGGVSGLPGLPTRARTREVIFFTRPGPGSGAREGTIIAPQTPELREELCAHLAQGAPIKTACEAVGISRASYYSWRTRGKKARDEPPPTLELTRRGLIDLLAEADVTYPARATKTALLRLLTLHRQGPYLEFLESIEKATAVRTLASLVRIEAGAEGGALVERTTTTRTAKDGTATTTTVRERFTPPDWRADGWFLKRRHPTDWSRRAELVMPDHEKAAVDPLVGVHDELRLARLARQKEQGKSV